MRISRTGSAFGVTTLFALAATFAPFELPHGWKPAVGPILWMGSLFFGFCLLSHHVGWMARVRQKAAKKDVIILSAIFLLSGVVGTSLFLIFQCQSDRQNQVAESSTTQTLPPSERPFITISPIKDKQDHYINIIESPDSVTVEMTFEIKNSGTVETEAFVLAGDAVNTNPSTGETQIIPAQIPSHGVALAPGGKFGAKTRSVHKEQTAEQRAAFLSELRSATLVPESSNGVYTNELRIEYANPKAKWQRFRTTAVFKQTINEAIIVSQLYDELPPQNQQETMQPSPTANIKASPN